VAEIGTTDFGFLLYVCLCICAQRTGQSDQFKTVKATDFKFDDSGSAIPKGRHSSPNPTLFLIHEGVSRVYGARAPRNGGPTPDNPR